MVKIILIGALKQVFDGRAEIHLNIEQECDFITFVKALLQIDPRFNRIFDSSGSINPGYLVFVDGVDVNVFDSLHNVKVRNNSEIMIVPVVHGG